MTRSHRLFGGERQGLEEAFPGDVIGVVNPGLFVIGDTVSTGPPTEFPPIPSFPPENFGRLANRDVSKSKQFRKGLEQLEEEGVTRLLYTADGGKGEPVLAAVGRLQFDVVESRLLNEYGVTTRVQPLSYTCARWLEADAEQQARIAWPHSGYLRAVDARDRPVCLFESEWTLERFAERNPGIRLSPTG